MQCQGWDNLFQNRVVSEIFGRRWDMTCGYGDVQNCQMWEEAKGRKFQIEGTPWVKAQRRSDRNVWTDNRRLSRVAGWKVSCIRVSGRGRLGSGQEASGSLGQLWKLRNILQKWIVCIYESKQQEYWIKFISKRNTNLHCGINAWHHQKNPYRGTSG